MTRVQGGGQQGTGGHAKDCHDDGVCVKVPSPRADKLPHTTLNVLPQGASSET